jgi:hypothetical protein
VARGKYGAIPSKSEVPELVEQYAQPFEKVWAHWKKPAEL